MESNTEEIDSEGRFKIGEGVNKEGAKFEIGEGEEETESEGAFDV